MHSTRCSTSQPPPPNYLFAYFWIDEDKLKEERQGHRDLQLCFTAPEASLMQVGAEGFNPILVHCDMCALLGAPPYLDSYTCKTCPDATCAAHPPFFLLAVDREAVRGGSQHQPLLQCDGARFKSGSYMWQDSALSRRAVSQALQTLCIHSLLSSSRRGSSSAPEGMEKGKEACLRRWSGQS